MKTSNERCQIMSYMVPEGPLYYANAATVAVSRCETHNWDFGRAPVTNGLCPLGRIEEATEEAIAKIKAAGEPS